MIRFHLTFSDTKALLHVESNLDSDELLSSETKKQFEVDEANGTYHYVFDAVEENLFTSFSFDLRKGKRPFIHHGGRVVGFIESNKK